MIKGQNSSFPQLQLRYNCVSRPQLFTYLVYLVISFLDNLGIAKLISSQKKMTDLNLDETETSWLPEVLADSQELVNFYRSSLGDDFRHSQKFPQAAHSLIDRHYLNAFMHDLHSAMRICLSQLSPMLLLLHK